MAYSVAVFKTQEIALRVLVKNSALKRIPLSLINVHRPP